jgi:hypothetical protein
MIEMKKKKKRETNKNGDWSLFFLILKMHFSLFKPLLISPNWYHIINTMFYNEIKDNSSERLHLPKSVRFGNPDLVSHLPFLALEV